MEKTYRQLSIEERTMIQTQLEMGLKPAAIAMGLNRSASTLSRECRRNGWVRPMAPRGPGRPKAAWGDRAEAAVKGFSPVRNRIEAHKRLSLTDDQGRAMAAHHRLTEATGVKVYFADPHSPWQRGINENTNGLLRQYLPKDSDVSGFTQNELDAIAWTLHTRPRTSLGVKCPAELFTPDAFDFRQHHAALFVLARWVAKAQGAPEMLWEREGRS